MCRIQRTRLRSRGFAGERTSKNPDFVAAVAATNVRRAVDEIRPRRNVLAGLEKQGKIKFVGSKYNLVGRRVEFFEDI